MEQEESKDIKVMQADKNALRRNVKDTVFTRMCRENKYLLQLYRSLHPEDTTTTEKDFSLFGSYLSGIF